MDPPNSIGRKQADKTAQPPGIPNSAMSEFQRDGNVCGAAAGMG